MYKVYRINGVVDFYVNRNQLKSLISDKTEVLNKPVGRCLLLLIEKRYEIIEQATFFSEVWNKFGVFVTPNTFYQNISLLRKSLSAVGLGDDVVKTVSRKGLMLSHNIEIEFIDYERNFLSSSAEPAECQPLSDAEVEPAGESEFISESEVSDEPQLEPEEPEPVLEERGESDEEIPRRRTAGKIRHIRYLWLIALLIFLIVLSYGLHHSNVRVSGYFDNYAYLFEYKGCHLFSNALAPKGKVLNIIDNDEISCSVNKYSYITTYDFSIVSSVVQCQFELGDENKNNHCVSHLFVGEGMEK
ncbi:hypothetical protein HC231_06445 [Brenneria izadpanahii]|uniref:OmpR/PhoB-type domain-containing protein n=1 Tax=Brenneria izadpanahii TaxID=2722756 RepID=A0ABX7UPK7_9GAMM|nr:hypothetical protein [Brenneria izadpanahii]QTF07604.1 hypothetical protein HC231_06445 [Brenneria izadpanahii]